MLVTFEDGIRIAILRERKIKPKTIIFLLNLRKKLEIERNLHEAFEGWQDFSEEEKEHLEYSVRGDIELAIMTPGIVW